MITKNVDLNNKTILVTGAAGFIGAGVVEELLGRYKNVHIVGIDNMNDYYDVSLKEYRLSMIDNKNLDISNNSWTFIKGDIANRQLIDKVFEDYKPSVVVNLAAQAGVRHSIDEPDVYIESNIIGFYNILEACRHSYDNLVTLCDDINDKIDNKYKGVEHLIYASSSSIYGDNAQIPYSTKDKVDSPVSLYAATKKSNELMAHAYAKLYNIPCTGLRFFTVYGPAGRPDMAYFGFTNTLVENKKIKIFNYGNCKRDFTYIDDILEGVVRVMEIAPSKKEGEDGLPLPPYRLYNIGNSNPENLLDFVKVLSDELIKAKVLGEDFDINSHMELVSMQPGDVSVTYADTSDLEKDTGFKPSIDIKEGLANFAKWYKKFYEI